MHLLLTDILSCPRCGPAFGLILLADRVEDRRVMEGGLGCANCRNRYPIGGGVADLRVPGAAHPDPAGLVRGDAERAFRLAALSGIAEREGTVLVLGVEPAMIEEIGRHLPNARVVGVDAAAPEGGGGVEWLLAAGSLPFRDRTVSALLVVGEGARAEAVEMGRVLLPGGRLVLDGTGSRAAASLPPTGWSLLLEQDGVAVASRTPPG